MVDGVNSQIKSKVSSSIREFGKKFTYPAMYRFASISTNLNGIKYEDIIKTSEIQVVDEFNVLKIYIKDCLLCEVKSYYEYPSVKITLRCFNLETGEEFSQEEIIEESVKVELEIKEFFDNLKKFEKKNVFKESRKGLH